MSTKKPKSKRRFGCFTVLIIFVALIAIGGVLLWTQVLDRGPSKGGKQIIAGPVDPAASALVEQKLVEGGLTGVKAAVVPLPGGKAAPLLPEPPADGESADVSDSPLAGEEDEGIGNAVMLVLDPENGFEPAEGPEGKRRQALDAMERLVELNRTNQMDVRQVALEYQDNGTAIIALAVSMETMNALVDGEMDDAGFLAEVNVELKDIGYVWDLFR